MIQQLTGGRDVLDPHSAQECLPAALLASSCEMGDDMGGHEGRQIFVAKVGEPIPALGKLAGRPV
jgi:hypothetical protein